MKKIYIVTNSTYRPAVAFESKERAEAVCAMCGGSVDEVQVVDAAPSIADFLKGMDKTLDVHKECGVSEGGECDGGAE